MVSGKIDAIPFPGFYASLSSSWSLPDAQKSTLMSGILVELQTKQTNE